VLSWLRWGVASLAVLNLVAMVTLGVGYAWQHGLKPRLTHRRTRQRAFEQVLTHTSLDNLDL
jgi:hypothetical protein